jgi:glutamate-1-semialdehyde 2,1-aminomutase
MSGTEATHLALRVARAWTGRPRVVKLAGHFHGWHDGVALGVSPPYDVPLSAGIPGATLDQLVMCPANDIKAVAGALDRGDIAAVILEPAGGQSGTTPTVPGYLQDLRALTTRHGVVLIFDEVKTGLAIAAGGATERYGIQPDMVTLAKTLGGGLPSGAIGATDEVMEVVESETVFQVGTFNGNPLTMAAARAALLEVLTPEAYTHLDRINDRLVAGCQEVVERYRLPAYAVGISSKGCVMFSDTRIVDYETFKAKQSAELSELLWLYNLNRGIFMTPGREEEWTLSVRHDDESADAYIAVFEELARDLTA